MKLGNISLPVYQDVVEARGRLADHLHVTPVLTSKSLDALTGAELFFKCESFQKTGSFKPRGALNNLLVRGSAALLNGVATHSSGNYGQAVAWAAAYLGAKAHIVVPADGIPVKLSAIRGYGATLHPCGSGQMDREQGLRRVVAETGALAVHPFDEYDVIAGQGTAALELFDTTGPLDALVVPLGGGGLLSGTLLAASGQAAPPLVYGVEPSLADDGLRSLRAGYIIPSTFPPTIADGLRTSLGELTFPIIERYVTEILTVSEEAIFEATRELWHRLKVVVEPSSAVTLAAIHASPELFLGKRVGVILSGGNYAP